MTTTVVLVLMITSMLPVCLSCSTGLYGPTCRAQNVASNRPTSQSSNHDITLYHSGNAVDGTTGHSLDSSTCTHTAVGFSQPWWTVTLDQSYWIYRFTIYNRNGKCDGGPCGARLNGFTVSVGTSSGAYTTCYQDTTNNATGPGDVINQHCTSPVQGNTVKISLSSGSPLTLCEVLIYGISGQCPEGWDGPSCKRENVALSRRTSQSSNYDSAHYRSGNAVDGKTGNSLENTPCTNTEVKPNQYWTVTLDKSYWIYRFTIYNRNETCGTKKCGERLNGFNVSVGTSSGAYTTCYKDSTTSTNGPGDVINEHCTSPVQGNTVKISLSSALPLTLCEVLIYVCADGWYGEMCDKPCVSTTTCLRCDPTGTRCGACVSGKYGPDCGTNCGFCAQGQSVCNTTSGSCPIRPNLPRCMPGYSGEKCDIACVNGKYGPDCGKTCGFCDQGQTFCNTTSGSCPIRPNLPRCMPGYSGEKCDIACQPSKWGADCLSSCGHCYKGPACDKASGECTLSGGNPRCSAGYHGTHCDHECLAGEWGVDCATSCGQCYNGTACNRTTGECTASAGNPRCSAGYGGTLCVDACQAGKWGADCQSSCGHCYNGATCYKASGECTTSGGNPRCSAGYKGTHCDNERMDRTKESCGFCADGQTVCNTTSGHCLDRSNQTWCMSRYFTKKCDQACPAGKWGADCPSTCGHCYNGTVCDKASGECTLSGGNPRCSAGYRSMQCDEACSSYRWGPDCEDTCGQCHGVAVCDGVTGECPPGNPRCATGYTGLHCIPCDAGKWGSNCLFTCSENCVVPTCNVTTGVCEGGCNFGYTGGRCNAVASPQVIDYTAVIIGCVVSVIVAAAIITTVVLVVRRRQFGSSQEAATSARNTGGIQEVSSPEVPSQGRDSGPNKYYNMAAREENPYETVTDKKYDKIRLSRLDTDTNYTNLN